MIMITGVNGQVGFELQRSLSVLGRVVAVDRGVCDLSDPDAIRRAIREIRPNIVVNPAAYTAVDRAESEPELAHAINAVAPGIIAEEVRSLGSLLIHYSTDYVFDGNSDRPYREDDEVNPLSAYGKSKLAGERSIAQVGGAYLIFRTSWVYGVHGNNFAKTMLRLARERDALKIVADQYGAPTGSHLIADVTAQVIRSYLLTGSREAVQSGIYHLAAGGVTTWFDYARHVIRFAQQRGVELKVNADAVEAITTDRYPLPAPRPKNSCLDTSLLKSTFHLDLPDWQQSLDQALFSII